jgi:hypothetical protein
MCVRQKSRHSLALATLSILAMAATSGAQSATTQNGLSAPAAASRGAIAPAAPPMRGAPGGCPTAACAFDTYDPRYFLDVFEITRTGERHPIHLAAQSRALAGPLDTTTGGKTKRPAWTQEVSHNGSIALRFDRAFLRSLLGGDGLATTMTIRGEYIRAGKVEKLEVPGYSEVGQEARQSRITAIALLPLQMSRTIREFSDLHSRVESQIALAVSRLVTGANSQAVADVTTKLKAQVESLAALSTREAELLQQFEQKTRDPTIRSTLVEASTLPGAEKEDSVIRLLGEARVARAKADSSVRAAQMQFEQLVEQQKRAEFEFERARTTGVSYLAARDQLLALTDRLTGGSDTLTQNLSAMLINRDPASLVAQGRRIRDAMAALQSVYDATMASAVTQRADSTRTLDNATSVVQDLLASFARLEQPLLPDGQPSSAVSDLILREFADPTIALMATPVEPGDDVRLIVISTPKNQGAVRQYSVRVKIVDFGFNERKRDVSSLIRRNGVNARADERRVQQFLGAKKQGELFINDAVMYQPAVGAIFGWQLVPRRSNEFKRVVRWLAPSVGLHVATPQFGARVYRFEEDGGTVKIEDRKNVTDVGVGFALGFWDDKVVLTKGWAITAIEKRSYFSLGLSLISLADGALSLAKSAP